MAGPEPSNGPLDELANGPLDELANGPRDGVEGRFPSGIRTSRARAVISWAEGHDGRETLSREGGTKLAGGTKLTGMVPESLRVAIVGAGPAGFYAAQGLLNAGATVDLFERLPAPSGLVRYGVAPDHQKIKGAARAFDRTAHLPGFRYFGNVEIGRDLTLEELRQRYDQVLVTIGAAADRRLGIPGEELAGSVSAVSVVGWYNGHPDFPVGPPLDGERAVVVGVGNVALDVARVLLRHPVELEPTDIDDEALDALRESRLREVVLVGRRGPGHAAFDLGELKELTELVGVEVGVSDPEGLLQGPPPSGLDGPGRAKWEAVQRLPRAEALTARRRIVLRFFASPREIVSDGADRVASLILEQNAPVGDPAAGRVTGTARLEELSTSLVIRSIGYRVVPLPGLPFSEERGVVPSERGRVLGAEGKPERGLYVAGWIKRGPTGLIGTNRSCALETVKAMLEDAREALAARAAAPSELPPVETLLAERGVRVVSYEDWIAIDAAEVERGQLLGRVRVKARDPNAMLALLDRAPPRDAEGELRTTPENSLDEDDEDAALTSRSAASG